VITHYQNLLQEKKRLRKTRKQKGPKGRYFTGAIYGQVNNNGGRQGRLPWSLDGLWGKNGGVSKETKTVVGNQAKPSAALSKKKCQLRTKNGGTNERGWGTPKPHRLHFSRRTHHNYRIHHLFPSHKKKGRRYQARKKGGDKPNKLKKKNGLTGGNNKKGGELKTSNTLLINQPNL